VSKKKVEEENGYRKGDWKRKERGKKRKREQVNRGKMKKIMN
jgi:hypothetical protein